MEITQKEIELNGEYTPSEGAIESEGICFTDEMIIDFAKQYHKEQLKLLDIDNVIVSLITEEEVEKKAEFRAKPRRKDNDANEEFIHGFMQGANWVINKVSPDDR